MFDERTLQELAPVQQERRAFNVEQWRVDVAHQKQTRAAAGVALGRLFRAARESLPGSQFNTECEAAGFHHLAARSLIAQSNVADGIAVAPKKARASNDFGISKAQAKAILSMRDDPDSLFAALEEVVAS